MGTMLRATDHFEETPEHPRLDILLRDETKLDDSEYDPNLEEKLQALLSPTNYSNSEGKIAGKSSTVPR